MDSLKLAIGQMESVDSFADNLEIILDLMQQAAKLEAQALFLPENCLFMRLDKKQLPPYLNLQSNEFKPIKDLAAKLALAVHLGGVGLQTNNGKFNASVFVSADGSLSTNYNKQKLFDIELEGKHSYRESDAYNHGEKNAVLDFMGFRFGQSICFDLRFSSIYENYAKQSVDAILIPSSFLVPTGKAHWHILNRARAIETQSYVISAAQTGNHKNRHQSFGHSLVVDPWGELIVDLEEKKNSCEVFEIDKSKIRSVREQMPMRR
ncbi:MAG: nitrilase-related carbon-nitrogen hydrolase [Bdellovibrionota bacterium]|nr:nitrilase-related carbon-nitrogen hydrolase [Bdellovibrionota bacterium]